MAITLPIDAQRFIEAFALPSLVDGTKSPIRAVHAGVAIEPIRACRAISRMSWVAFVTNIIGIHSVDIMSVPRIMKGIRRLMRSLRRPQKTCITLFEMFEADWNHPMSDSEAPSFMAYAPMKGLTIPAPSEFTTERA